MALEVAKTRLAEGDDPNMREDGDVSLSFSKDSENDGGMS